MATPARVLLLGALAEARALTTRALEAAGFVVTACPTLAEALQAASALQPHVLVVDLDGLDVEGDIGPRLAIETSVAAVPLLVLSASATRAEPAAGRPQ